MQFRVLVAAAAIAFASFAMADDPILQVDYPKECADWCGPAVTASHECGDHSTDCICSRPHISHVLPLCEACTKVQKGSQNQDYHQNVLQVMNVCGFKKSHRQFSAANAHVAPAMGAGAIAAFAALAAL